MQELDNITIKEQWYNLHKHRKVIYAEFQIVKQELYFQVSIWINNNWRFSS